MPIKGADEPVAAQRLLGVEELHRGVGRAESTLVGRQWEVSAVEALLERAIDGHGAVVGVVGPPGIGKSRLVREVAAIADARGVEVFTTFCESHTSQVPFHVVARLLRAATGVEGLDAEAARAQVRARVPDADPEDLALFDDLLGIIDPDVELPKIDPDARRRRLTALVNGASLARQASTVYVIEDVHWIDEVSESMLAEFLTVIPQTPSLVLVTYRPEYRGALIRVADAHTVALAPLSDSETTALVCELLGGDPSVGELGQTIAESAAGNPFFAEEIVRELAERGVLREERGAFVSTEEVAEVSVPATLQATIAARIDRLDPNAKRTLSAAAVLGSRFSLDLLAGVGVEPVVADLVAARFIDQVRFTRQPEYVFHHPLVRAVAYESQLKSDRAQLHRRVAAAIESRDPAAADENAALIAEHLEAAGDLRAAYGWHMRAGAWLSTRDVVAAWASWERARQVADALPADDADRTAMRIAARALLCRHAFRVHVDISSTRFPELRELCAAAGDKWSLAIGMAGLGQEHMRHGRLREASRLASETMALVESIGATTLTITLSLAAIATKTETGEVADTLRLSQTVIDLADGDPTKGNIVFGSPLAMALATRGTALWALGRAGWRDDYGRALAMARRPTRCRMPSSSHLPTVSRYRPGCCWPTTPRCTTSRRRLRSPSDRARISRSALPAGRWALRWCIGSSRPSVSGLAVLGQVHDMCFNGGFYLFILPVIDVWAARERARCGDRDVAIPQMRAAVDDLFRSGQLGSCVPATGVLVETLLERGANGDVSEAEAAIGRLAAAQGDEGRVIRDIWLLRMRALLARAQGDDTAYRDYRDRHRAMVTSLGFEGHMQWAEAMP